LYRLAAEEGDARGQYNLGRCYYHCLGVDQNFGEAEMWFRLAAEQGDLGAKQMLLNFDRQTSCENHPSSTIKQLKPPTGGS